MTMMTKITPPNSKTLMTTTMKTLPRGKTMTIMTKMTPPRGKRHVAGTNTAS